MPLYLDDKPVPATEWVLDGRQFSFPQPGAGYLPPPLQPEQCRAWWEPDEWGAKPRTQAVDLLVGHWTAGEAGTDTTSDDGPRVVRAMKLRPGIHDLTHRLRVSVHFVIGAGGEVWQTADPLRTTCIHVGEGKINARSVGVEIVNKGFPPASPQRPRPVVRHPVAKILALRSLAYLPVQLEAWKTLAHTLALYLPITKQVPAEAVPGGVTHLTRRFTKDEAKGWTGAMEHWHVPSTHKLDGGGQLVRALAVDGWPLVLP